MIRTFAALAASTAVCAACSMATAEPWFKDASATHLPAPGTGPRNGMDVQAADLDADGDLDLVIPQEFALNRVLLNAGGARFVEASDRIPPLAPEEIVGPPRAAAHDSEDVSIADFDGDGRLDLVIVSEDDVRMKRINVHQYYRGRPGGAWERVLGQLPDTEADAVAHADLNGDRRPDLIIAGAGQDRLLINDGKGGFRDETAARLPVETMTAQDAEFADLDRDGDLDLVLGLEGGHALWLNDGKGVFRDETAARLPDPGNVEARKVVVHDVDKDGDLDLYFAHVGWQGRLPQDRLYLNDGKGRFTDVTAERLPEESDTTLDAQFADLDKDGDEDLVTSSSGPVRVLLNDKGRFRDATLEVLPVQPMGANIALLVQDLNGDRWPDIYVAQLSRSGSAGPSPQDWLFLHRGKPKG
jgi:hypothetical protein